MPDRELPPNDTDREETVDPKNPPNSVVSRPARTAATATFVGGLLAVLVIVGAGWFYWQSTDYRRMSPDEAEAARQQEEQLEVGTTGSPAREGPGRGGFNPEPSFDDTKDELEFRGAGTPSRGPMPGLGSSDPITDLATIRASDGRTIAGRRADITDVDVISVQGNTFWLQDGSVRVEAIAPDGAPAVRVGQSVDVSGTLEPNGDTVRLRTTRITVR